jgi:protein gp37
MYKWAGRAGKNPRQVTRSKTRFRDPLRWPTGQVILTCSLSDFFIEQADLWRPEAWAIIEQTPHHTYLETISIKAPSLTIPLPCGTNRERDHERIYAANHLGSP